MAGKKKEGVVSGTRVTGVAGKRTKVITPKQAELKRLLKYAATLPDAKSKKVVKPVVKKIDVKVTAPKGVKARGLSAIEKRLARLKRVGK